MRLDEIVARFGGELSGDGGRLIRQVATLERAGPEEISFLANLKYREKLGSTRAGAVILSADLAGASPVACIVCDHPYLYFARVAQCLNPATAATPGIHPAATVEASIPASVCVAAGAHIGPQARIGERARIGPGCVIGAGAELGADALLHANVTIYAGCRIGARAIVHSGAVIGADGFGFAREHAGENAGAWFKIPQIGRVLIGDDVEIGANTTIDRGALDDTVIEDGVKFDNQIQVGHNVRIGAHCALAGCVGIAGSATLGRRCTVGGGAIILGHLSIADDVNISAGTLVSKSIPGAGTYTGAVPFLEHTEWLKNFARLRQLDTLADRIRALEAQVKELASSSAKPEEKILNAMDINQILAHLPHRYPFLLVDRVLECVPGERILALKNVTINEPFFPGHFPRYPVMPGVLILEALAQAAAILSFRTMDAKPDEDAVYFFVGIDAARFKKPVRPGDQLMLEVSLQANRRGLWKFKAQALVDGQVATEAELMCTVRNVE